MTTSFGTSKNVWMTQLLFISNTIISNKDDICISIYFLYRRRRNNSLTFFYSFCIVSKIHLNIQEESLPFHRLQLSPTNNDNIEAAPKNSSNYFFPDFLHWLVFSIVFFTPSIHCCWMGVNWQFRQSGLLLKI